MESYVHVDMEQMLQYHWKLWGQCGASKPLEQVAEILIRHTEIVEVVVVSFSLTGDAAEENSPSSCPEGFAWNVCFPKHTFQQKGRKEVEVQCCFAQI